MSKEKEAIDVHRQHHLRHINLGSAAFLVSLLSFGVSIAGYRVNQTSLLASNRAWLAPIAGNWTTSPAAGQPFGLEVIYQNVGKEPALNMRAFQQASTVSISGKDIGTADFKLPENQTCEKIDPGRGGAVYPSSSPLYSLGLPPNKQALLHPAVTSGDSVLVWQGCFLYETFGQQHQSSFCFWLRPYSDVPFAQWKWNFCSTGNDAN